MNPKGTVSISNKVKDRTVLSKLPLGILSCFPSPPWEGRTSHSRVGPEMDIPEGHEIRRRWFDPLRTQPLAIRCCFSFCIGR